MIKQKYRLIILIFNVFLLFISNCSFKQKNVLNYPKIQKIIITGNTALSQKEIEENLYSKIGSIFSPFSQQENIKSILELYKSRGFIFSKISSFSDSIVNLNHILTYNITEGPQSILNSITIYSGDSFNIHSIFKDNDLIPGLPVNQNKITLTLYLIASEYISKGYYNVKITDSLIPVSDDSLLFDFLIKIDLGSKVYISEIDIRGNGKVRDEIIYKEINFKEGDLFYPSLLDTARSHLYYTWLFSYVSLKPFFSKSSKDSVKIIINLDEDKISYISTHINYQTDNKIGIALEWGNKNIFGNAQNIVINSNFYFNFQNDYIIGGGIAYNEPYFFNSGFIFSSQISGEKYAGEDNSISYIDIIQALGRNLSTNSSAYLAYKFHFAWIDTSIYTQTFTERKTNSILIEYDYDSRDNRFSPTKGLYRNFEIEIAGGYLGGDNDFYRFSLKWGRIFSYNKYGGFFLIKSIYTLPYGKCINNNITIDQQLHLGGVNSVRGYSENSIGPKNEIGNRSGIHLSNFISTVYYNFYSLLSFELFLDAGGLCNSYNKIDFNENFGLGAGVGLRIETPAGPIRLEYGHSLIDPFNKKGIIHFGFGNPF